MRLHNGMNRIPNIISALRIPGAICLLIFSPASVAFWVFYGLCGISDMLDGYLARKLHAESRTGRWQMPPEPYTWMNSGTRKTTRSG